MYVSASELTVILPQNIVITGSSVPLTFGEIASTIVEVSAELDSAAAAAGYTVPVPTTATYAHQLMQRWTKQGAGAQVLHTLFPNMGGPGGKTTLASEYAAAYAAALKALREGKQPLVGAPEDTTGAVRELPRSYSTSNPTATAGVLPLIAIDQVF